MSLLDIAEAANDLAALLEATAPRGLRHPRHAQHVAPARAKIKAVMAHYFERQRKAVLAAVKPHIDRQLMLHPIKLHAEAYNPDEPRIKGGPHSGEWTSGGGGGGGVHNPGIKITPTKERAWDGKQTDEKGGISKLETGRLGESIVLAYLQSQGMTDARPLNAKTNNFPVDAIEDHGVIEIKTGLSTNGKSAQQWRATIGQPGKEETKWLKSASAEEKAAWNEGKAGEIISRKEAAVKEISREQGHEVKGRTMTVILNPSTKVADIYQFSGFHSRIAWGSAQAKAGYIGSVKYG